MLIHRCKEMASRDFAGWVYLQRWGRWGPGCCMSWEEPLALSASSSSTGGTRHCLSMWSVCVCVCAAHSAARPAPRVHHQAPGSSAASLRSPLAAFSVNSSASFWTSSRDSPLLFGFSALAVSASVRAVTQLGCDGLEEVEWSGALRLLRRHALIQTPPLSPRETELQVCVAWCNHSHLVLLLLFSACRSLFSPPLLELHKSAALFGR